MLVENIVPRNVIFNRGAAEVDNHISRDDFFDYYPLKNVIFILLYRTLFLYFLTMVREVSKAMQFVKKVRMIEIISFTKRLCL